MRKIVRLMKNWQFIGPEGNTTAVDLPHTWNAIDGQDGGNDYWRGTCVYRTSFAAPAFEEVSQQVWLQFEGVNASAKVVLNDTEVCVHDGGYSTFRANITTLLREENILTVEVDNRVNDHVYPQKADFTFYGGIYRDVSLLVVHKDHIALGHYGDTGVKVTPTLCKDHTADIRVETRLEGEGTVRVTLNDAEGNTVAAAEGKDVTMTLAHPHLWDGVKDPYLYTCVVELEQGGEVVDTVSTRVGVRSFRVDPKKGFFLNGRSYPLHGVSRHQDRKGLERTDNERLLTLAIRNVFVDEYVLLRLDPAMSEYHLGLDVGHPGGLLQPRQGFFGPIHRRSADQRSATPAPSPSADCRLPGIPAPAPAYAWRLQCGQSSSLKSSAETFTALPAALAAAIRDWLPISLSKLARICASTSAAISGFSSRYFLAASRP